MELSILRNFFMLKNLLHIKMRDGNKTKRDGKKNTGRQTRPLRLPIGVVVGDGSTIPLFLEFYVFLY